MICVFKPIGFSLWFFLETLHHSEWGKWMSDSKNKTNATKCSPHDLNAIFQVFWSQLIRKDHILSHYSLKFIKKAMTDSLMNHSNELNLFNESIDPVYKTSLNCVLTYMTDPVLKLNSVAASKIEYLSKYFFWIIPLQLLKLSYRPILHCKTW